MQRVKIYAATLCAAIGLVACASGGDRRDGPPSRGERGDGPQRTGYAGFAFKPVSFLIASMDVDADHRVEISEFEAGVQSEWASLLSAGSPGALNYAKWSKRVLGAADALPSFITFDRNLDGQISELEFTDYLSKQFVSLDANSDDVLEASELVFRIEQQSGRGGDQAGQGRGQRGGGGNGGRGEGGGRPPR